MLISHSIQQATRFNCKKVYGCKSQLFNIQPATRLVTRNYI